MGYVKCKLIGEDSNIFNLMGLASRALRNEGYRTEADEMCKEVMKTITFDEALFVITKYVDAE